MQPDDAAPVPISQDALACSKTSGPPMGGPDANV